MRIHVIQHDPLEGLDYISEWIDMHAHHCLYTRISQGEQFPSLESFDMLLVMGGPMGVYETDRYNWLIDECAFIRKSIDAKKKVLGICLGAQLIAHSLGAHVYRNSEKEIGWFPVKKTFSKHILFPQLDNKDELIVFQWHGDTFDIPSGAEKLFESDACANQAFTYSDNVLAIQFHFEMAYSTIKALLNESIAEFVDAPYIQPVSEIHRLASHYLEENKPVLFSMLDVFTK